MNAIDKVTAALEATGCVQRALGRWGCPCHGDDDYSLGVSEGRGGRALIKCYGGCATPDVVRALGLTMRDLF